MTRGVQYTLLIEDGSGNIANEITFNQGAFNIGRLETNDVQLPSSSVSRQHARIFIEAGRCFIEDLNSSNGVLIDGHRIFGSSELPSGSSIQIGEYMMVLQARRADGKILPPSATRSRHDQHPRLIRIGDMLEGETFALVERDNNVGRADDNFVLLSDSSVSRHHCTVVNDMGRFVVIDHNSSNGTRINEQTIGEPTLITGGDLLRIGNIQFVFAEPGQPIDLRDYSRYLASSGRGVVVAITVMALLLVLVACAIVIFLVLDKRSRSDDGNDVPVVQGEELAQNLLVEGLELMEARNWSDAVVKLRLALENDADLEPARTALVRAEADMQTEVWIRGADRTLSSAERSFSQHLFSDAAERYLSLRGRLVDVDATSAYYQEAVQLLVTQIDPALIEIRQQLAVEALTARDHALAAQNLGQALEIWEALPEDSRLPIGDNLRTDYWQTLIAAGDAAHAAGEFSVAVTHYQLAAAVIPLTEAAAGRLNDALQRLAEGT